jgi:hypothetical protein
LIGTPSPPRRRGSKSTTIHRFISNFVIASGRFKTTDVVTAAATQIAAYLSFCLHLAWIPPEVMR